MYLTFIKENKVNQTHENYSLDDLFSGVTYNPVDTLGLRKYNTKTIITAKEPSTAFTNQDIQYYLGLLRALTEGFNPETIDNEYYTFKIPKHSGGLREINAPKDELMNSLREMQNIFQYGLRVLSHNAAYAYVPHRNIVDALKIHQQHNSRWFLKLDIKNFFPSCNKQFVVKTLHSIYPFAKMTTEEIESFIWLCFKNNELPQGTPMSPLLSNLIMTPIDFAIQAYAFENNLVYTRYADDILISGYNKWDWKITVHAVNVIFSRFQTPFLLNEDKTRYGSSAGRNWNLGLMYNKDNKITVGYRKKKQYKAMINNLFTAEAKNEPWDKDEIYHFQGITSYYLSIEPNYFKKVISKYEEMYNISLKDLYKIRL